jgi:hypothetical protein
VDDHVIAFGNDRARLISQGCWRTPDQIEQAIASGFDVRAVLDVVRRPKAFRLLVVPLVEQRIKRFENQFFVCLFDCFHHLLYPSIIRVRSRGPAAACAIKPTPIMPIFIWRLLLPELSSHHHCAPKARMLLSAFDPERDIPLITENDVFQGKDAVVDQAGCPAECCRRPVTN